MIRRKNRLPFLVIVLGALLFVGCRNKVIVTRSYVYSSSWAKGQYQGFTIAKIKLLDSTTSVFSKGFDHYKLDEHLVDSSFCYGIVSQVERRNSEKIFFNDSSKLYQWYNCQNGYERSDRIGDLKLETWYIITGLHGTEDFYVYIDKDGEAHTYSLGPTNW